MGELTVTTIQGTTKLVATLSDEGNLILSGAKSTIYDLDNISGAVDSVAGLTGVISATNLKTALAISSGDVSGLGALATLAPGTGVATALRNNVGTVGSFVVNGGTGLVYDSVAASLVAHSGGGQSSALALTAQLNSVSTVALAGDSVQLPAAIAGASLLVLNDAALNAMQVFGKYGNTDTINGIAGSTGISQLANTSHLYVCTITGAWETADNSNIGVALGTSLELGSAGILSGPASNVLELSNSTAAQTLRIYNTKTDASNYERLTFDWQTTSNVLRIGTEALGTGTVRNIAFVGGNVSVGSAVSTGNVFYVQSTGISSFPFAVRGYESNNLVSVQEDGSGNGLVNIYDVNGALKAQLYSTAASFLTGSLQASDFYSYNASFAMRSKATITGGSTSNTPTLTTGPATGNPTKWLPYDDNGVTRYIPAW